MSMATPVPELLTRQRRLTVEEYHRMIEAGILDEDEHVQLIGGFLVAMTPQGIPHARVIQRLNRLLVRAIGEDLAVRPQLPLTFEDSEPEPDLAVVRADEAQSGQHHPRTALLVIEVSGDSLSFDRGPKSAVYARAGIPEYWIVSLEEPAVEAYREPDPATGTYRTTTVVRGGHAIAPAGVPGLAIDVAALFR
jgi:Uma2 family endonuclease